MDGLQSIWPSWFLAVMLLAAMIAPIGGVMPILHLGSGGLVEQKYELSCEEKSNHVKCMKLLLFGDSSHRKLKGSVKAGRRSVAPPPPVSNKSTTSKTSKT
ncbi:hypothetical protein SUGI_0258480 [Cryptomeria japonica]|nr:hypothetical protein SUGI_0258480 [Cryptomeria japonica]